MRKDLLAWLISARRQKILLYGFFINTNAIILDKKNANRHLPLFHLY
jgi:hypothetical protein